MQAQVYIPSANSLIDNVFLSNNGNLTITDDTAITVINTLDAWVDIDLEKFMDEGTNGRFTIIGRDGTSINNAATGDVFYFRKMVIDQLTADGAGRVIYDQSGNGRHAEQTTALAQPTIVKDGVIVTDGAGNPAFEFDGVDDALDLTGDYSALTAANVYAVTDNAGTVTLDTLTAQNLSAATTVSDLLTGITYQKVALVMVRPDATDEAAIETEIAKRFKLT